MYWWVEFRCIGGWSLDVLVGRMWIYLFGGVLCIYVFMYYGYLWV